MPILYQVLCFTHSWLGAALDPYQCLEEALNLNHVGGSRTPCACSDVHPSRFHSFDVSHRTMTTLLVREFFPSFRELPMLEEYDNEYFAEQPQGGLLPSRTWTFTGEPMYLLCAISLLSPRIWFSLSRSMDSSLTSQTEVRLSIWMESSTC